MTIISCRGFAYTFDERCSDKYPLATELLNFAHRVYFPFDQLPAQFRLQYCLCMCDSPSTYPTAVIQQHGVENGVGLLDLGEKNAFDF